MTANDYMIIYMKQQKIIKIIHDALSNDKKITALNIYQGGKALQIKTANNEIFNIMTVKVRNKFLILSNYDELVNDK